MEEKDLKIFMYYIHVLHSTNVTLCDRGIFKAFGLLSDHIISCCNITVLETPRRSA